MLGFLCWSNVYVEVIDTSIGFGCVLFADFEKTIHGNIGPREGAGITIFVVFVFMFFFQITLVIVTR